MTRFEMKRRFLNPRVFEVPNMSERAIKGYSIKNTIYFIFPAQIRETEPWKEPHDSTQSNLNRIHCYES